MSITRNRSITGAASLAAVAAVTLSACGGAASGANAPATSSSTSSSASTSTTSTPSATPSTSSATAKDAAATRAAQPKVGRSQARPVVKPVVKVSSYTRTLGYGVVRHTDSSLAKGTSKVTQQGVAGLQRVTLAKTMVGGTVTKTVISKRETVKAPVAQVVTIGTKRVVAAAPKTGTTTSNASTAGLDMRRSAMWDRISQCESSGNWSTNTGNGYYGGLQFDSSTWLGAGGGRFAARADLASRAQQITIANKVYDQRGLQPWECGWAA